MIFPEFVNHEKHPFDVILVTIILHRKTTQKIISDMFMKGRNNLLAKLVM